MIRMRIGMAMEKEIQTCFSFHFTYFHSIETSYKQKKLSLTCRSSSVQTENRDEYLNGNKNGTEMRIGM